LFDLASLDAYASALAALDRPLCIIGPHLKTCDAFEACRRIRVANSQARVAFVSQHCDDPIFKADAAYAGALACMPVEVMPDALLNVLCIVQTGSSLISLEAQQVKVMALSSRELDVLRMIADSNSDSQIADALCLSVTTVRKHSQRILQKLGVHDRRNAVHRARHRGWIA
jgi:DNA-binding NarL/FixJ family response regulator